MQCTIPYKLWLSFVAIIVKESSSLQENQKMTNSIQNAPNVILKNKLQDQEIMVAIILKFTTNDFWLISDVYIRLGYICCNWDTGTRHLQLFPFEKHYMQEGNHICRKRTSVSRQIFLVLVVWVYCCFCHRFLFCR
jgi:hypothetical protein